MLVFQKMWCECGCTSTCFFITLTCNATWKLFATTKWKFIFWCMQQYFQEKTFHKRNFKHGNTLKQFLGLAKNHVYVKNAWKNAPRRFRPRQNDKHCPALKSRDWQITLLVWCGPNKHNTTGPPYIMITCGSTVVVRRMKNYFYNEMMFGTKIFVRRSWVLRCALCRGVLGFSIIATL